MSVPSPYANADAAISGIVGAVENPVKDVVHGFLDSLNKSVVSISAQWVGNGTFQAASPSFTGVAGGLTGVSASFTAVQADATGFTFWGRHYDFSTLGKGFDWQKSKSASLTTGQLEDLTSSVDTLKSDYKRVHDVSIKTEGKVAKIQSTLARLPEAMDKASGNLMVIRKNTAEINAIKKEIRGLTTELGSS